MHEHRTSTITRQHNLLYGPAEHSYYVLPNQIQFTYRFRNSNKLSFMNNLVWYNWWKQCSDHVERQSMVGHWRSICLYKYIFPFQLVCKFIESNGNKLATGKTVLKTVISGVGVTRMGNVRNKMLAVDKHLFAIWYAYSNISSMTLWTIALLNCCYTLRIIQFYWK